MTHAVNAIRLAELAHKLADRAVVADIEGEGIPQTDEHGRTWYDTRPMLDPREQPDDNIEMSLQAISYAHERGLISQHPVDTHLVRITKAGA